MQASFKEWQDEVRSILNLIALERKPYSIDVDNVAIEIFPDVFSPKYFTDSAWFATTLPNIVGESSLLEIGTGTGIISTFAALKGAKVTATDVNPCAVKNAIKNFSNHNLSIPVFLGEVFDPLDINQKFDYIFWNHPFNFGDNPQEEILLRSCFDYQYASLKKYISEARNHLRPHGKLLLGTGNYAELNKIEKIAETYGYEMLLMAKKDLPISSGHPIVNDYRIYEIKEVGLEGSF